MIMLNGVSNKEFFLIINFCRKLGGNGGAGPVKRFSSSFACTYKMSGKITHQKIRQGVKSNVVFQKKKNIHTLPRKMESPTDMHWVRACIFYRWDQNAINFSKTVKS